MGAILVEKAAFRADTSPYSPLNERTLIIYKNAYIFKVKITTVVLL